MEMVNLCNYIFLVPLETTAFLQFQAFVFIWLVPL